MWHSLKVNGVQYFILLSINDTKQFCIILTDVARIWRETLDRQEAIDRFKTCNPKVELSEERIIEFMNELLELSEEGVPNVNLDVLESGFLLNISRTLIIKMSYHFILVKQDEETVYRNLTLPLLVVINELKHTQGELYKLLEAKDQQLKEFELEGFQISRKNVITPKFNREEFERNSKTGLEERIRVDFKSLSAIFTEDVNEVYPVFQKVALPLDGEMLKSGMSAVEENISHNEEAVIVEPKSSLGKRSGNGNEETFLCKRMKVTKKIIL